MSTHDAKDPHEDEETTLAAPPVKPPSEKHKEGDKHKDGEKHKDGDKHKEKDRGKEVFKEATGKEGTKDKDGAKDTTKDGTKETSKDAKDSTGKEGKDRESGVLRPGDLGRGAAVNEIAVGIGAHFIAPEERPEVGEAAMCQPLDHCEG